MPAGNLPPPLSSFIGRTRELQSIRQLLSDHRLVTLTGPGGAGKTRLATHASAHLGDQFEHGIWIVEFAPLSDPSLVPHQIASTIGLKAPSDKELDEQIIEQLVSRKALLLMDNCEHLAAACARVFARILSSCSFIRILTTSREPVGVRGEVLFKVPPLSLPDPQPWLNPGEGVAALAVYEASEAVQLFVDRASVVDPDFRLDSDNGPWVARLCRRLDGIPLAIELAAARVRTFTPRQITERLDDRFQLLTSHLRTGPDRHQTLEAALEWSFTLLSDEEKAVLQQLSVFRNGWTLEAAESVCGPYSEPDLSVTSTLANLVDKSLVVFERNRNDARYKLLETIRQYAAVKLENSGQADERRDRHIRYYAQWAHHNGPSLASPDQLGWLQRFDLEQDNLRAAHEWGLFSGSDPATVIRLAAGCGHYWRLRGMLSEGRARLSAALEAAGSADALLEYAWALLWSANLAYVQSDYIAARTLAEEALERCQRLGDPALPGTARALDILGEVATEVGEYQAAPDLFEQALEIYRDLKDLAGEADMLMQLGWAAMRLGDYPAADRFLNEARLLFERLQQSTLLAQALSGLGELAVRRGEVKNAQNFLNESLRLRRELGERWGEAVSLGTLGWSALLERDFKNVRSHLGESLVIRQEIGDQGGQAWCLEKLGEALMLEAQPLPSKQRRAARRRAVRAFAAASSLRQSLDSVIDPADEAEYQRRLKALRRALGQKTYKHAWEEGSRMPIEAVIAACLESPLSGLSHATLSAAEAERLRFSGLSPRERETAALIAQGKTNREIAEQMVVRTKTIETYVTRILNKLSFDSRVQIATWVVEVGLDKET